MERRSISKPKTGKRRRPKQWPLKRAGCAHSIRYGTIEEFDLELGKRKRGSLKYEMGASGRGRLFLQTTSMTKDVGFLLSQDSISIEWQGGTKTYPIAALAGHDDVGSSPPADLNRRQGSCIMSETTETAAIARAWISEFETEGGAFVDLGRGVLFFDAPAGGTLRKRLRELEDGRLRIAVVAEATRGRRREAAS